MEILKLNLAAFGPFTDQNLVFDKETRGINIVYGPNEAGKSSALRGLKALLYGIDSRSPDNFIHANEKLRIAGNLRAADGQELAFARRKGRKNTLLSLSDKTLDESILTPFLQSVTQELFEMLFGIDHRTLIQGGQEILEQKGKVGQALFSASIGSHALHAVLSQLAEEADGIFKPQGSTKTINIALKNYTSLNKEIRDRSLSSKEWDKHQRALVAIARELEEVQTDLTQNRVEVNRLKRIQRVLPKLARRYELLQKLKAVGDVIVLPDDFGKRRQNTFTELQTAQAINQKAASRLKVLQEQLKGLFVRPEVLGQCESIESLHARLGGHRKALQDRPHLDAECKQLLADAGSLLKDVRPNLAFEEVEVLRPVFSRRQRIIDLGNQSPVLESRVVLTKNNLRETKARLKEARAERQGLPDVGPTDPLRKTIATARKSGDVDSAIQLNRSELTTLQEQCAANLARLGLWSGELKEIPGLPVPTRENVNRFDEKYIEIDKRSHRLHEKQEETEETLRETLRQLDEIQRGGAVPTEENLNEIRSERDQIWQLLRRQWVDREDVGEEAKALLHEKMNDERTPPDAFESRVIGADDLADRLRRETDRVHTQANLLAEQKNATQRAKEIAQLLDECAAEKTQLNASWNAIWAPCKIQPDTPREMRAWLDNLDKLRDQVVKFNALRQRLNELDHTRNTYIQELKNQLHSLEKEATDTESLDAILLEGEGVVNNFEQIQRQRESLDKEIVILERKLELVHDEHHAASSELDKWKAQWKVVMDDFGLECDATPSEAADGIDKLRELFAKQNEAEKLQIRIQAIDQDAKSFIDRVGSVVATVDTELARLPSDEAVVRLNTLLSESKTQQSRYLQVEEQIQQAQQDIEDSQAMILTMTNRLDAQCVEAKCDSPSELEDAERRSSEYTRLRAEVARVEQEIVEAGEGATLAALEMEVKEVDPDTLPAQIEAVTGKIDEELEPKRTELAETKGREERELELMDGSDTVAELADQAQSILSSIRSNSEQYVRLKLATRILRDEIERYRKENQGPLIHRASEHFASLTCGSFKGLRTDFNEKDEPILAGIRPNEERVHVEGMSGGTRDQLYLALRLASIEKYMENSEPIPFIVDDILVDFDDERSEAALSTLAELAKKTQVILFTHHSKVVEQARKLGSSTQVHELR